MALGPVLLGYGDPAVDEAIRAQLDDGITFTLMHPLEVEVAERIVAMCPGVEAVRFGKTGSDAVVRGRARGAGVHRPRSRARRRLPRLARLVHRDHHARGGRARRAVRELTARFPFNDLDALGTVLDGSPAGRRRRPRAVRRGRPRSRLPRATGRPGRTSTAPLVVFDEVITGFRLGPGGARERYGVLPDLSCYGKALGNGMPISAVGGRVAAS